MTVRPAPGVSRIGLRTADGCFYPLVPETFRGVRQVVLTTAGAAQRAADVELFLEEPGGGERYHHLGTVRMDAAPDGAGRPDLVLRVSLDAGGVLHAAVTGPVGQGELRVALQRFTSGETALRTAPELAGVRETIAAGLLDGEPPAAPAAATWRDAGGRVDAGGGTPVEPFVYRCTSALPVNATPYDRERVRWLAERPDLSGEEVDLLRSVYRRLAQDRDPARAGEAHAALRALDERPHERDAVGPGAPSPDPGGTDAGDPVAGGATAAGEAQAAFERREYGEALRLLHAARAAGAGRAIPADIADYWLDARSP